MATYAIVTAIIKEGSRFLIAKRADTKRFSPGQWEFIAGFMDKRGTAEEIILEEFREELGVEGEVMETAPVFQFRDDEGVWVNITVLAKLKNPADIKINQQDHSEIKWVTREELNTYEQLKPFLADSGFSSLLEKTV